MKNGTIVLVMNIVATTIIIASTVYFQKKVVDTLK